jgi:hypothetical protein
MRRILEYLSPFQIFLFIETLFMNIFLLLFRLHAVDYYAALENDTKIVIKTEHSYQFAIMAAFLLGIAVLFSVFGGIFIGKQRDAAPPKSETICKLLKYDLLLSLVFPFILANAMVEAKNLHFGGINFYLNVIADSFAFYANAFVMKALCYSVPLTFIMPFMANRFFSGSSYPSMNFSTNFPKKEHHIDSDPAPIKSEPVKREPAKSEPTRNTYTNNIPKRYAPTNNGRRTSENKYITDMDALFDSIDPKNR